MDKNFSAVDISFDKAVNIIKNKDSDYSGFVVVPIGRHILECLAQHKNNKKYFIFSLEREESNNPKIQMHELAKEVAESIIHSKEDYKAMKYPDVLDEIGNVIDKRELFSNKMV